MFYNYFLMSSIYNDCMKYFMLASASRYSAEFHPKHKKLKGWQKNK